MSFCFYLTYQALTLSSSPPWPVRTISSSTISPRSRGLFRSGRSRISIMLRKAMLEPQKLGPTHPSAIIILVGPIICRLELLCKLEPRVFPEHRTSDCSCTCKVKLKDIKDQLGKIIHNGLLTIVVYAKLGIPACSIRHYEDIWEATFRGPQCLWVQSDSDGNAFRTTSAWPLFLAIRHLWLPFGCDFSV